MGRPHGVDGELYVDHCPIEAGALTSMGALEWRSARGGDPRSLTPTHVHEAVKRLLVTFAGVTTREAAAALVGGTLWAEADRLPDAGPGRSYAYELVGLRVVDTTGRELGTVTDVVFNAGQPLLALTGGKLLPCQPPFLKHLDRTAGVITLDLPPGFDEL